MLSKKLKFLFIFTLIKLSALTFGAEVITIKKVTNFRSGSFYSDMTYLIGVLEPGTKVEVLDYDLDKVYGAGIRVLVDSGVNKGRVGWIYVHMNKSKRTISIKDEKGNEISQNRHSFRNSLTKAKDNLPPINKVLNRTKVSSSRLPIDSNEVWDKIFSGEFRVLPPSGDPMLQPYLTIAKRVVDNRGGTRLETYSIPNNTENLLKVTQNINSNIIGIDPTCNDGTVLDQQLPPTDYKGTKGCELLAKEIKMEQEEQLHSCLIALKKKITKGAGDKNKMDRDIVYKNMYELNQEEQNFLAMTLTSFGEAGILAPPLEEMIAIMKVLENRTNYAKQKGFEGANALDASLQKSQFSMWHKKDPNWQRAVRASSSNPHTVNSIKAFIKYKQSSFKRFDNVYHYHTNYVAPDWSENRTEENVSINDVKIQGKKMKSSTTKHRFFKNIAWSFNYTKFKPKDQR